LRIFCKRGGVQVILRKDLTSKRHQKKRDHTMTDKCEHCGSSDLEPANVPRFLPFRKCRACGKLTSLESKGNVDINKLPSVEPKYYLPENMRSRFDPARPSYLDLMRDTWGKFPGDR
jgi:rRNA maturation protein Nop10